MVVKLVGVSSTQSQFILKFPLLSHISFLKFLSILHLINYITYIVLHNSTYVAMKRQREIEVLESIDLANCLVLLSPPQKQQSKFNDHVEFECKTCNRKFSSFQALGGHRTSHKRPKHEAEEIKEQAKSLGLGNKPKFHKCSICGQEFSLGQALGGHMKRHRTANSEVFPSIKQVVAKVAPVLKRSNSLRVMWLDLNLTPLENDLKLLFGKMAPKVDAYL
ncbi:hypothetical protein RIF29_40073 [Crotalaria pallida]|uniref:C2H2-type domain-containing protein n=1 Tax=Crotalaria pallida TaxID=3830 RepID=A0AAN9HTZ5_CROPI